jgi:hypothetical protein
VPKDVVIPVSRLSPIQAEAWFFAVLVEPADVRARKRLIEAEELLFTDPVLAHHDPGFGRAQTLYKKAVKIIEEQRLIAGEIAIAYIWDKVAKEAGLNGIAPRVDGEPIGALTIDNLCSWATRQQHERRGNRFNADKVSPNNFRQRGWKNSKPVLHLAAVVQGMTRGCAPAMKPFGAAALSDAFSDQTMTEKLFETAEQYRGVLLGIATGGAFPLEEKETIRLSCS